MDSYLYSIATLNKSTESVRPSHLEICRPSLEAPAVTMPVVVDLLLWEVVAV